MLKKNNIPVDEVMKVVAKENGFTYVPPEKRTPKELVVEKNSSGDIVVSLKDVSATGKHVKIGTPAISKSNFNSAYKRKRKVRARKTNRKSWTSAKKYG